MAGIKPSHGAIADFRRAQARPVTGDLVRGKQQLGPLGLRVTVNPASARGRWPLANDVAMLAHPSQFD